MNLIVCYIPNVLREVSAYVLSVMEDRLGVKFQIKIHEEFIYRFEYGEASLILPSYFILNEKDQWLQKRSDFGYEIKTESAFGSNFYQIKPIETPQFFNEYDLSYQIDLIGSVFVLLSRYEEYVLPESEFDHYDRFKPESAVNCDFIDIPIADELMDFFENVLEVELGYEVNKTVPSFSVLPSHDVDRPFEYLYYTKSHLFKRLSGDIVVRKSVKMALNRLEIFKKVKRGDLHSDPYNTFEWIMDQSEKYNRTSSFHFISQVTDAEKDQEYDLKNSEIKSLFKKINQRGHQIALHPSFESSKIKGQVSREATILREFCNGLNIEVESLKSRYHYLRWNNQSIQELEEAEITTDQTLGYASHPGFRCGTCHPYQAFNFKEMKASTLEIEPLILMELSLFSHTYLNLENNLSDAWNIVSQLKEQCKKHTGNFTVLWHNNNFDTKEMQDFYTQSIK